MKFTENIHIIIIQSRIIERDDKVVAIVEKTGKPNYKSSKLHLFEHSWNEDRKFSQQCYYLNQTRQISWRRVCSMKATWAIIKSHEIRQPTA